MSQPNWNEEEDNFAEERSTDFLVSIYFLCHGDFYINRENCYSRNASTHKSATMFRVMGK